MSKYLVKRPGFKLSKQLGAKVLNLYAFVDGYHQKSILTKDVFYTQYLKCFERQD